jgi:hypothetical protein
MTCCAWRTISSPSGVTDLAAAALEDLHVELFLELLDRHAERGLRHEAGLGGAAEVPLAGHGDDVLQLGEGHEAIVPA